MSNPVLELILETLDKLTTTNNPKKIERFYEKLGEPLTKALLVYKGQAWPGIRVAEKPGYVFYNGLDRQHMRKRLYELKFSF